MEEQDLEYRFAFNFDLDEARLKELYPAQTVSGYKRAWSDIRSFLEANGFTHAQYSGYESTQEMTYAEAYATLEELHAKFSWFSRCAQAATITEIGERYDVLEHLKAQTVGGLAIFQPVEQFPMPEQTLQSDTPGAPQTREDVANNIAEAVEAKLAERKSKGTPSPGRGKKRPSR